jgi:hypothetical protein
MIILGIIAWLVLCGSVLCVAVVVASHIFAVRMARRKQAGSEYIAMFLWPFYVFAPLAGIAGALAGFWLAPRASSTAVSAALYITGGALAAQEALWLAGAVRDNRRSRAQRREVSAVVSQDEMIRLIRSGAIRSFARKSGSVGITYENYWAGGKYQWLPHHADPDGFDSYVTAARALAPGLIIAFADHDAPRERLFRWITVDEAADLLDRGLIKTFNYGTVSSAENEPASGERTGIKLIDHDYVRHIYVEPSMEDIMVPLARAAQRSRAGAPVPQFCINGSYEHVTWITAGEAAEMLESGFIRTFYCGTGSALAGEPAAGKRTGIKLNNWGMHGDLYVEPSMEDTVVPVARAAQRAHNGVPKLCIDGKYEHAAAPEQG